MASVMLRRGPDAAGTADAISGNVGSLEGVPHGVLVATARTSAPDGLAGPVVERSSSILSSTALLVVSVEPSLMIALLHSFDSLKPSPGDETD